MYAQNAYEYQAHRWQCVGGQPCEACTKRRLNCIFDESTDGRRKTSRKRKAANLERESTLLTSVIANFRDGSREEIDRMVALIRAVPSVEEAKDALERQALSERRERTSDQRESETAPSRPSSSVGLLSPAEPSGRLEMSDLLQHGSPIREHEYAIPQAQFVSNLERPP